MRRYLGHSLSFIRSQPGPQGIGHALRHFAFHAEDIVQRALVALAPQVGIGPGIDQLHVDQHVVAGFLHAAFKYRHHPQLGGDLPKILWSASVLHGGCSGNDLELADLREPGQDQVLHPAGEIGVVGIPAEVVERQDGNRTLRRLRRRRWSHSGGIAAGGITAQHELVGDQQDHSHHQYADDPLVEASPACTRRQVGGIQLALALEPLWREFIEPRKSKPEREPDRARGHEPAHHPIGNTEHRRQLRDALRQRPDRADVKRSRPQHVAALELGKQSRRLAHAVRPVALPEQCR